MEQRGSYGKHAQREELGPVESDLARAQETLEALAKEVHTFWCHDAWRILCKIGGFVAILWLFGFFG